jgi:ergothioneine biosynthesis protein EgtB
VSDLLLSPVLPSGARRAAKLGAVRAFTEQLAAPLSAEDQTIQSMPDASPTKWHLAHTSWFFETFILRSYAPRYSVFDPAYEYLFNSYYEAVGPRHPRPQRGLLSRPGVDEIMAYRHYVTSAMAALLEVQAGPAPWDDLVELGIHHEQQHQELLLMDIKHALSMNPTSPAYLSSAPAYPPPPVPMEWIGFEGGLVGIGHENAGFSFDNEGPRHRVWLEPFALGSRLVTSGEYLAFIEEGGYRRPEFWLSAGWERVNALDWRAPLYWHKSVDAWQVFTLFGNRPLQAAEPVCHVSFYEAAAFAKWAGKRLPREAEWEVAAAKAPRRGNTAETGLFHPSAASQPGLVQMIGDVWEWTASPYVAYPGYSEPAGAIGEYNGKFMANQMVLRGGCAVTPPDHVRTTYRNFFPPDARWVFGGIRLAEDLT